MHITGITVGQHSHPAFDAKIQFRFDERVNVLVGANASGKTSLLRVLGHCGGLQDPAGREFPAEVGISEDWEALSAGYDAGDGSNSLGGFSQNILWRDVWHMEVPWTYVPAARIPLPGLNDLDNDDLPFDPQILPDDIRNEEAIEWHSNAHIFDGRRLEAVVRKLFEYAKSTSDASRTVLHGYVAAVQTAYSCAKAVSSEILTGLPANYVSPPFEYLVLDPEDIEPLTLEPSVHPAMGTSTTSSPIHGIVEQYVGNLSAGTQGTYLWTLYLAMKMASHYKFERGWMQRPAILLIDEIENHLHPTWQRRVIPALLEHFPGLQIFATTHSPFVVAGLKAGQVHLLNRDENGVVTASTNQQDIVGWTADEILRTMMGVQDPTDDETAWNAAELRRLRNEGTRDTPEEEEHRQAEMQRLRRLVNRDLLAGGPREAQRELFEQQFGEALEKYLQSQDLNQDNG